MKPRHTRRERALPAPTITVAPGGHVCAVADHDEVRGKVAASWVGQGLAAGELVVWVEPSDGHVRRWLSAHDVPWDEGLSSGQLRLSAPRDMVALDSVEDIPRRLEQAVELTGQAVAEGFAGVRVGVETAMALRVMPDVATQLRFEAAWEALTPASPMSLLCLYDPTVYGPRLRDAAVLHPRGLADGLAFAAADADGMRVVGEIDFSNAETFRAVLQAAAGGDGLVVDLTGLSFIDVRGTAQLVELARALAPRGRLRLVSPPRTLRRIVEVLGWSSELDVTEVAGG